MIVEQEKIKMTCSLLRAYENFLTRQAVKIYSLGLDTENCKEVFNVDENGLKVEIRINDITVSVFHAKEGYSCE